MADAGHQGRAVIQSAARVGLQVNPEAVQNPLASGFKDQCLWPHIPEPQPPPWKDGLAQAGSAYWLALLLPCTAGADTSFRTSALPHSGQAGAGSLILCITV